VRGLTTDEHHVLSSMANNRTEARDITDEGESGVDLRNRLTAQGRLLTYEAIDEDGDPCQFWSITPRGLDALKFAMVTA
jgi:hypothetical protein